MHNQDDQVSQEAERAGLHSEAEYAVRAGESELPENMLREATRYCTLFSLPVHKGWFYERWMESFSENKPDRANFDSWPSRPPEDPTA